jgi:hypothetical protein
MSDYIKMMEQQEDILVEQISGKNLMEYTTEIAKWARISGTKDELDSMLYCQKMLDSFGYKTELIFYPAFISVPVKAFVEVETPKHLSFRSLGHPFTPSTPSTGLVGNIVPISNNEVSGKIVLSKGLPSWDEVMAVEKLGAIGVIYIQDAQLHNMPVSPIWGAPTEKTEGLIPKIPVVSITRDDGAELERLIKQGKTSVRMETRVDTDWCQIPLLEANMPAENTDKFLLFSSHIDSWDYGAMDNGAANATLIECARLLAKKQNQWKRGLRLAFWSGHSQGKFFGSAWYADHHFEELEQKCIGHVYVDSTGGKDAVVITEAPVMPQTKSLAADVIKKQTGEDFLGKRIGHYADQSFYGVGLTSLFGTFSEQDADKNMDVLSFKMGETKRAGGLGWWWHTEHDTMEIIDKSYLVRDTKIYLAVIWRLLTKPVLPYDFCAAVDEMEQTATDLSKKLNGIFDMSLMITRIQKLKQATEEFYKKTEQIRAASTEADEANEIMLKLSHKLVRVMFHDNNCFDFDLSGEMFPIPSLVDGEKLIGCPKGSHRYYVLKTQLQRGYNRVMHYLAEAIDILAEAK